MNFRGQSHIHIFFSSFFTSVINKWASCFFLVETYRLEHELRLSDVQVTYHMRCSPLFSRYIVIVTEVLSLSFFTRLLSSVSSFFVGSQSQSTHQHKYIFLHKWAAFLRYCCFSSFAVHFVFKFLFYTSFCFCESFVNFTKSFPKRSAE